MNILVNKTFDIITPESAVIGDFEESGFEFQNEPFTFRELVELMSEHPQPSQWPNNGGPRVWLSSYGEQDFRTGEEKTTSIHFSRENDSRMEKYWTKAMKFAGLLK